MTTRNDEEARQFIRRVAATLREEDFMFSVDGPDKVPWDVYKFRTPTNERVVLSEPGMLALRMIDGQMEIGFFRYGFDHTPESIEKALAEDAPS